jgi:hypothetical protein
MRDIFVTCRLHPGVFGSMCQFERLNFRWKRSHFAEVGRAPDDLLKAGKPKASTSEGQVWVELSHSRARTGGTAIGATRPFTVASAKVGNPPNRPREHLAASPVVPALFRERWRRCSRPVSRRDLCF